MEALPENPQPERINKFNEQICEVIWIETGGRGPIQMTPIGLKFFMDFFFIDADNFEDYLIKLPASTGVTSIVARHLLLQRNHPKLKRRWHFYNTVASIWVSRNFSGHEAVRTMAGWCYFGHGIYGLNDASRKYFNKTPNKLNLEELSLLIGLTKSPSRYSPWCNPELALKRTNELLEKIYIERNWINNFKKLDALPQTLMPAAVGTCNEGV